MLLGYWGSEVEDTNQIKLSSKNLNSTLQRRSIPFKRFNSYFHDSEEKEFMEQ